MWNVCNDQNRFSVFRWAVGVLRIVISPIFYPANQVCLYSNEACHNLPGWTAISMRYLWFYPAEHQDLTIRLRTTVTNLRKLWQHCRSILSKNIFMKMFFYKKYVESDVTIISDSDVIHLLQPRSFGTDLLWLLHFVSRGNFNRYQSLLVPVTDSRVAPRPYHYHHPRPCSPQQCP